MDVVQGANQERQVACLWHLSFNAPIMNASDIPSSALQPMVAPREDVAVFQGLLQSCNVALAALEQPIRNELMLLKRLIHRNKSQHRASVHMHRLRQLRLACERLLGSGLGTLRDAAEAATHYDPGMSSGYTMPSRELLDLLLARLVSSAVLCQRASRGARLAFRASEELVRHALFMPLAITCLSLSARLLALTTKYEGALAEGHLRLVSLLARAPINPQSVSCSLSGPALIQPMLARRLSCAEICPSDFAGQVAWIQKLLGENTRHEQDLMMRLEHAAADCLTASGRQEGKLGSTGRQEGKLGCCKATASGSEDVGVTGAHGDADEQQQGPRKSVTAARQVAADALAVVGDDDVGVSVQDLGVCVENSLPAAGGKGWTKPKPREKVKMRQKGGKHERVGTHFAGEAGPASTAPATHEGRKDAVAERKKKTKKKGDEKRAGGSGAAALAALAKLAQPPSFPIKALTTTAQGDHEKGALEKSKGGKESMAKKEGQSKRTSRPPIPISATETPAGVKDDRGALAPAKLQTKKRNLTGEHGADKHGGIEQNKKLKQGTAPVSSKTGGKGGIFSDLLPSGASWDL